MKYKEDGQYLKQYEEARRQEMYQVAREWGSFAGWDVISRYLDEKDLEFIREFRYYIHWYLISDDLRSNPNIQLEFKKELKRNSSLESQLLLEEWDEFFTEYKNENRI